MVTKVTKASKRVDEGLAPLGNPKTDEWSSVKGGHVRTDLSSPLRRVVLAEVSCRGISRRGTKGAISFGW